MGDPRRIKKKYTTPRHPWRSDRIEAEKKILREYGLTNKKEIWGVEYSLRRYRGQARRLLALHTEQVKREEEQLLSRLKRLNLVGENATLDDVLALKMNNILNRRLQTVVLRKGLANTIGQARQFVVHGHISIGDRKVTAPSYLVKKDEENDIQYTKNATVEAIVKPTISAGEAPVKAEEAE
ncbi:MAG: 30S ribosomal protein S4 [Candidatus Hydrothermarchaeaceae archaeon]